MEGLGLGNLGDFKGIHPISHPLGTTATLKEVSNGKDTMTGHSVKWESSEAFANSIGVKKNSFQKRISQNRISKVSGMYDHYEITYI